MSIQHYREDVENRNAIAWCTENGVSRDGDKYETEYMVRYEFDEDAKLKKLSEYNDSELEKRFRTSWLDGQQKKIEQRGERSTRCRRFYLITYPRTGSNLLVHILALDKQSNVVTGFHGGYMFMSLYRLIVFELRTYGKRMEEWTQDQRNQIAQRYQDCFNALEDLTETADAEGKAIFIKEHSAFLSEPTAQTRFLFGEDSVKEPRWTVQSRHTRTEAPEAADSGLHGTILPDDFLQTWLSTFLIRHPALVFPSLYRASTLR